MRRTRSRLYRRSWIVVPPISMLFMDTIKRRQPRTDGRFTERVKTRECTICHLEKTTTVPWTWYQKHKDQRQSPWILCVVRIILKMYICYNFIKCKLVNAVSVSALHIQIDTKLPVQTGCDTCMIISGWQTATASAPTHWNLLPPPGNWRQKSG